MKITVTKLKLEQIIKEEILLMLSEGKSLTDEEEDILDIGPAHPHYHRVARKAKRLSGGYAGPGGNWADKYTPEKGGIRASNAAAYASLAQGLSQRDSLNTMNYERGMAAIAEPMIALGMDPSNYADEQKFGRMTQYARALDGHFDRMIAIEAKAIDALEKDFDTAGTHAPVRFGGKELSSTERKMHVIKVRTEMYSKFIDGSAANEAAKYGSPSFYKKLSNIMAKLRPMPAYTPGESEAELEKRGVKIKESKLKSKLKQIIKEEFDSVMLAKGKP